MEGSRISKRTIPTRVPGAATVGSGQYRKVTGACQQVPARREIGAMFVTPQYHEGALCRTWVQDSEHGTSVVVREVQGEGTGLDSIPRPIPVSGVGPVPAPEELAGMVRGRTCEPPCPKAGCGKTARP